MSKTDQLIAKLVEFSNAQENAKDNTMKEYSKAISYAYASSTIAEKYNNGRGCYYVELCRYNNVSFSSDITPCGTVFENATDAIDLFIMQDAEVCTMFAKYKPGLMQLILLRQEEVSSKILKVPHKKSISIRDYRRI